MAGDLGQLFRPQKIVVQDRRAMELEAAGAILAEVMRSNRFGPTTAQVAQLGSVSLMI